MKMFLVLFGGGGGADIHSRCAKHQLKRVCTCVVKIIRTYLESYLTQIYDFCAAICLGKLGFKIKPCSQKKHVRMVVTSCLPECSQTQGF